MMLSVICCRKDLYPPYRTGKGERFFGGLKKSKKKFILPIDFWNFIGYNKQVICRCGGMADATDSKSVDGDIVWVQVPPPAPLVPESLFSDSGYFFVLFYNPNRIEQEKRESSVQLRWLPLFGFSNILLLF